MDAAGQPGGRARRRRSPRTRRGSSPPARRSSSTPPRARSRSPGGSPEQPPNELTLVTNSPAIVLRDRRPSRSTWSPAPASSTSTCGCSPGRWTVEFLEQLNFDVAFVSAAGRDARRRADDVAAAARRRAASRRRANAEQTIGLIDATKFGRASLLSIMPRAAARPDHHRRRAGRRRRAGLRSRRRAAGDRQRLRRGRWHVRSRCSPASGPTCRSRTSPRKCGGWGFDGLELACWGDHFDVGEALRDRGYCAGRRETARAPRAGRAGRSATTSSGRRCATRSTSATAGVLRARGVGRRRPRGRARARRRGDEGHRARGGAARRHRRHRLHRLVDLAPALLVPAQRPRGDRARLRGLRRALEPDHRRLRGRGRALRARGPSDGDRLRLRDHAQGAGGDRRPRRLRDQLRPQPPRAPVPRLGRLHRRVRPEDLPRARQGLQAAARRPLVDPRRPPRLRRAGARLGLRLARARRRRLRGDVPRAQPRRLRRPAVDRVGGLGHGPRLGRAGRARASCGARTSRPRRSPSTRRSRRRRDVRGRLHHAGAGGRRRGRASRSASGCSATRSWARRTPTPTRRSPT